MKLLENDSPLRCFIIKVVISGLKSRRSEPAGCHITVLLTVIVMLMILLVFLANSIVICILVFRMMNVTCMKLAILLMNIYLMMMISQQQIVEQHCHTHRLLTSACSSCSHDVDNMLTSDHFINAPSDLHVHISILFSAMLTHGCIPNLLMNSSIRPIPKGHNLSTCNSNNYRGIAISSIFNKVLDNVVLTKYGHLLSTCDLQFGFKKKHSTQMCTMVLKETLSYYLSNRSNVFCTFLDATIVLIIVNCLSYCFVVHCHIVLFVFCFAYILITMFMYLGLAPTALLSVLTMALSKGGHEPGLVLSLYGWAIE